MTGPHGPIQPKHANTSPSRGDSFEIALAKLGNAECKRRQNDCANLYALAAYFL